MEDKSGFFSDPKVLISILAIIISILSLLWTLANQFEQNRRWDKLNVANVVLKRAILKRYKIISKEYGLKTNWGYQPYIYGSDVDDQYIIPYKLIAVDKISDKPITTINACYTTEEIKQELIRINYKGDYLIFRHFEPKFEFENKGKTNAKILDFTVDIKYNEIDWQRALNLNNKIELSLDQISTIELEMNYPINLSIPDEILFKIKYSYLDIHDNKIEKEIIIKWLSKTNAWAY